MIYHDLPINNGGLILQMNGGNRNEQEGIKPSSSWHVMVAPWGHDGDPPGGNQQYNMLC